MTLWEERAARNEALFRQVNEEVARLEERLRDAEEASFVCECASDSCVERIALTLEAYERVRAHPRRFLIRPGHEVEDIERVVESFTAYLVVEKDEVAGSIAERLQPD